LPDVSSHEGKDPGLFGIKMLTQRIDQGDQMVGQVSLVEAHIALGDLDGAAEAADRAADVSRASGLNGALAAADRAASIVALALARGDLTAASCSAGSAIDRAFGLGARLDDSPCPHTRGEVHR
jgi:hypothetical protein